MECGILSCGKYTIIGIGIGAVIGVTVYFLLPKSGSRSFVRHSAPPMLPDSEMAPAGFGRGYMGLKRRSRRW